MIGNMKILQMYSAMAGHAAKSHATIAENLANADTPGFRAKEVESFQSFVMRASATEGQGLSDLSSLRILDANGPQSPNGNTVSLEEQVLKSAEISNQHALALNVYRKSLDLLRISLGRQ
jgi:flagellar basal-body rod protein FlgB